MKFFTIPQKVLSESKHCRLDQKYALFTHIENWLVFDSKLPQVPLSEFLEELPIIKYKKGELDDDFLLVNISDQAQRSGELEHIEVTNEIGSDKNELTHSDIFISKLGMPRGYIFLNTYKGQNILGSTEFISYKIKGSIKSTIIKYLLLHPRTLKAYSYLETGKTPSHKRVNPYEFLKIKLPLLSNSIQEKIISEIAPIEKQIKIKKDKIKQPEVIINKVFAKHFGFDVENADKKKKELIHYATLEDLANEELKFDISLKYRHIFLKYIKNVSKIEWVELGKLVDVKGGKRLPKGQNVTEEETNYRYIRVDDLSWSGTFDFENIKFISEENHNAIRNYIANENDILLTIVGATVGKCGLVPAELEGENITENFARLIIRDKENYLPEYVNYCLQSKTSVYQIDEYKGRGSQGKLALFRIKKIKVPKIDRKQQKQIVDEIKAEFDKQKILSQEILSEREKIDKIIERAIIAT